jgi:uncharacterized iron-regulated membrane protein
MLSGHLALGLAASALIYILCVSGTVFVFHEEIERWEQPAMPEFSEVRPGAAMRAAESVIAELDDTPHHFYVGLPTATMPRLWVATDTRTWLFNTDGSLVAEADHEWSHFLEKLHYYLTLPWVYGLTLVGILGVLMAALCLSGVLAHPRLFRDAFRLRLGASDRLREADIHNRLSVWGLPFHFVIAATGAALGLSILVASTLAPVVNDGDTDSFFAPVFGAETDGDASPAPLADLAAALDNFKREHPEARAWYFSFHDPATADQDAKLVARHPRRVIFAEYYPFDAEGTLTGRIGLSDGPWGKQFFASLYPLHFGSFGGLPVKLAYGLLGLAACVVSASGFRIWLIKRRQRGRPMPLLEGGWTGVVWGTPLALIFVMLTDLLAAPSLPVLVGAFWLSLTAMILAAVVRPVIVSRRNLQIAIATGLLATVAAHAFIHGFAFHNPAAAGVSTVLLALFGWSAWLARKS